MKQIIKHVMKETGIIFLVIAMLFLICGIGIYSYFSPDNVFDQLYWDIKKAEYGMDSVLISGTDSAYVDYDMGFFANLQIPELDLAISYNNNGISFFFFNFPWDDAIRYYYNFEDQTLYGEESSEFFYNYFLSYYFKWCQNAGIENSYSVDDLGEYSFVWQKNVYW